MRRLIAMAGLPGSGKSTLARALGEALNAPVLNKDLVRAALFGARDVEYSSEQDDLVMESLYAAAGFLLRRGRGPVILDGRTFTRNVTVERLRVAATQTESRLIVVECICSDDSARGRIAEDMTAREIAAAAGRLDLAHPASNRSFELYLSLKAGAESIPQPKLVVRTDELPLPVQVAKVRAYAGI
ncbi:MAG: AAA family ATPase [Planctomycetota bacterium]